MSGTRPGMTAQKAAPERKRGRSPDPETTRVWLNQSSGDFLPLESRLPSFASASVDADGLQFVAPGVGDRCFPAIGQHDRRAVGGMQREKRSEERRVGEEGRSR